MELSRTINSDKRYYLDENTIDSQKVLKKCYSTTITADLKTRDEKIQTIQEALDKKKEMLEYIREQDLWLYHKLRYSILGRAANLPGRGGRKMFVAAYKVCQKFYGFN